MNQTSAAIAGENSAPVRPRLADVNHSAREFGLKPAAVRDLIYHAEERYTAKGEVIPANGFARCCVRLGHRIYIDLDRLAAYIEARRGLAINRYFDNRPAPSTDTPAETSTSPPKMPRRRRARMKK